MSLIPKTGSPTVPASVNQTRSHGAVRHMGASDSTPIEETSPQDGVSFSNSHVFQDEDAAHKRDDDSAHKRGLVEYSGPSQNFASIFEEVNRGGASDDVNRSRKNGGFTDMLARAITVYEATSRTIHGHEDMRGTSVSLTL